MAKLILLVTSVVFLIAITAVESRSLRNKRRFDDNGPRRLKFRDCGRQQNLPVKIHNLGLTPMPMRTSEPVYITINGSSSRNMGPGDLSLLIHKKTYGGYNMRIPCIRNIGSCTYRNSSKLIDDMLLENWAGSARDIAEQVIKIFEAAGLNYRRALEKFKAGNLAVKTTIKVPRISSIVGLVAEGEYRILANVRETSTGVHIACVEIELSIAKGCDPTKPRKWYEAPCRPHYT